MTTTRLELNNGSSDKYWEITVEDATHTVRYGRNGTAGRASAKTFSSPTAAKSAARRLIEQKKKKGYEPVTRGRTAKATATTRSGRNTKGSSRRNPAQSRTKPNNTPITGAELKARVATIRRRILPFVGQRCAYFKPNGDFSPVMVIDWTAVKPKQKTGLWNGILGDVSSENDHPGVVDVTYTSYRGGRVGVTPRWCEERWLPIALAGTNEAWRSHYPQFERLVCADLVKATATKAPIYAIGVDGTLATSLQKIANDLNTLGWFTLTPLRS